MNPWGVRETGRGKSRNFQHSRTTLQFRQQQSEQVQYHRNMLTIGLTYKPFGINNLQSGQTELFYLHN